MKRNIVKYFFSAFCLMFISLTSFPGLAATDQQAKTDEYLKMLSSPSPGTRINAAKYITRSGITSPKLYDVINEKLVAEYNQSLNPEHVDEMSWLCKALAASGSDKYIPTLETIANTTKSDKLKHYAKQSLSLIKEYAERNSVMNVATGNDPELSPEINKYINMLRSENITLKRDAAKSIYRHPYSEKKLFDVLNDELLKGYKRVSSEGNNYLDAMSWMCKALGSSGMSEYKQTLTEIIENSSNAKLVKYATQSRQMLE